MNMSMCNKSVNYKLLLSTENTKEPLKAGKYTVRCSKQEYSQEGYSNGLRYKNIIDFKTLVESIAITPFTATLTIGDDPIALNVSPGSVADRVVWASTDTSIATVDAEGKVSPVSAGTATIKATYTPEEGDPIVGTCEVTISKRAISFTAPTAKSLTYNGLAQELVNAGTAEDGTMQYAIGKDETTAPDASAYVASIPTSTNAGIYYVWYKAIDDSGDSGTEPACVAVSISKADPTFPSNLTAKYGQALAEVALPSGWSWVDSAQCVGDAGEKTFKANYAPVGDDETNYNSKAGVDLTVVVTKDSDESVVILHGIKGAVKDSSGNPIAGAAITIDPDNRTDKTEITTDANGNYTILGLSDGTYNITAKKDIRADDATEADIRTVATTKTVEGSDISDADMVMPTGDENSSVITRNDDGKKDESSFAGESIDIFGTVVSGLDALADKSEKERA